MQDTKLRPFTSRTRVALAAARALAAGRGDRDLNATHVALGILTEGRNPACAALLHAGAPVDLIRMQIERLFGEPSGGIQPREVTLDSTPGEAALVSAAEMRAEERNEPYLGTEHLLLAILAEDSPTAAVFAAHGFTPETAAGHLAAIFRGDELPRAG